MQRDICGYVGWQPHSPHVVEERDGSFYCEGFPYPDPNEAWWERND